MEGDESDCWKTATEGEGAVEGGAGRREEEETMFFCGFGLVKST